MTTRRRHARGRAGYSLVEVMVAMTAGAILLGGTYIISKSSNETFFRASRLATTQAGVRLAAEQVRGDIARAGFFGHPDTNGNFECGMAQADGITTSGTALANTVRAVELDPATVTTGDQDVRHDRLTMTGNYVTNERYNMQPATSTALDEMRVSPTDPAFQRSFVNIAGDDYDAAAFTAAFQQGRLVRVETYNPRRVFFRVIQTSNAGTFSENPGSGVPVVWTAEPTVQLVSALPTGCPGLTATNMTDGFIAPVTTIDYQVIAPGDATVNLANLSAGNADGGNMEWVMVRREWDYVNDDFFAGSERVVMPFALELRIAALWCAATTCPFDSLAVDTGLTTAAPNQMRGLRISMAARTAEVDRAFDPNGAFVRASPLSGVPLRSWRPTGALGTGRARVRSTNFDVALMNNR